MSNFIRLSDGKFFNMDHVTTAKDNEIGGISLDTTRPMGDREDMWGENFNFIGQDAEIIREWLDRNSYRGSLQLKADSERYRLMGK